MRTRFAVALALNLACTPTMPPAHTVPPEHREHQRSQSRKLLISGGVVTGASVITTAIGAFAVGGLVAHSKRDSVAVVDDFRPVIAGVCLSLGIVGLAVGIPLLVVGAKQARQLPIAHQPVPMDVRMLMVPMPKMIGGERVGPYPMGRTANSKPQ